jgi:hypothetical protein
MAALAESSLETPGWRRGLARAAIALAAIAFAACLAMLLRGLLSGAPAARHQAARIAILPDTPPPPPPREEKKPEPPKEEPKQAMREEPVKQEAPKPADAPIKMEGPAGDGPSAFAAGGVRNDYAGGAPVVGGEGGGGSPVNRAQERLYANSVRQLLHDEIEKHLRPETGEIVATFSIWIDPDGGIRRFELQPTGDAARDADLQAAFGETSRVLRLPGHGGIAQPLRFRLSVHAA